METTSNVYLGPTKAPQNDIYRRDNHRVFGVTPATFRKFREGKSKYSRWSKFLDEEEESTGSEIKSYATKNPKHTIVLQCSETGAMTQIRRSSSNGL